MLSGGDEDWDPNAAGWLEKYQINLDADILGGQRYRRKKCPTLVP